MPPRETHYRIRNSLKNQTQKSQAPNATISVLGIWNLGIWIFESAANHTDFFIREICAIRGKPPEAISKMANPAKIKLEKIKLQIQLFQFWNLELEYLDF